MLREVTVRMAEGVPSFFFCPVIICLPVGDNLPCFSVICLLVPST